MIFADRRDAGRQLSTQLLKYKHAPDTIILALPRGGVPVAEEVAEELDLPMDVWLVRKLGVPGHEELAMGAMAMGDVIHLNNEVIAMLRIPEPAIEAVFSKETAELHRRNKLFRQDQPPPDIKDKTVIVIDDGLATGATMKAAIESLNQSGAKEIIAAIPVGARSTCEELKPLADEVICLQTPEPLYGVGQWYQDFSQTSDTEVQQILQSRPAGQQQDLR